MDSKTLYRNKLSQKKCCVIIPTYNNGATLASVIDGVLEYTGNIIVVNDGSTDQTAGILSKYKHLEIIHQPQNGGKGLALRTAFKKALEAGYEYAITIDSDGQHKPDDIPVFIDKLEEEPDALIIGARNMGQDNIPKKSSFGHKFSNFWFWFETGINAPDTQSGYRLYPLLPLKNMRFFTRKYEFEIEVIVRAAWKGVPVTSVPISVYYAPKESRVSHFRPFRDFSRVSVLNTVLVIIALLYVKPFHFVRSLTKKNIIAFIRANFLDKKEPKRKKVLSVMFGVFMGIIPIWGYQFIVAILLSHLFKLNKTIVIVTVNISVPPMIPVILFLSYVTGSFFVTDPETIGFSTNIGFEVIKNNLRQYVIGSVVLAMALSIVFGIMAFFMLSIFQKKNTVNQQM